MVTRVHFAVTVTRTALYGDATRPSLGPPWHHHVRPHSCGVPGKESGWPSTGFLPRSAQARAKRPMPTSEAPGSEYRGMKPVDDPRHARRGPRQPDTRSVD